MNKKNQIVFLMDRRVEDSSTSSRSLNLDVSQFTNTKPSKVQTFISSNTWRPWYPPKPSSSATLLALSSLTFFAIPHPFPLFFHHHSLVIFHINLARFTLFFFTFNLIIKITTLSLISLFCSYISIGFVLIFIICNFLLKF